jgi:hypothetical protein
MREHTRFSYALWSIGWHLRMLRIKVSDWFRWNVTKCPDCGKWYLFDCHDGCIPF